MIDKDKYPLITRLLNKRKLRRYEICAIFALVLETLLKRYEICQFSEGRSTERIREVQKYLPVKASPKCPVCSSPHRWQYELYYLSCNRNLEWVLAAAHSLDERHITFKNLKTHFQKHFNPQLDISHSSKKSLEKITLREGPDFVENVLAHFLSTNEILEKLERRIRRIIEEEGEVSSKDTNLLKSLLVTFLRYASWLRDFHKREDEEVDNLGKLFLFEI